VRQRGTGVLLMGEARNELLDLRGRMVVMS
jgi:hypothetical protein